MSISVVTPGLVVLLNKSDSLADVFECFADPQPGYSKLSTANESRKQLRRNPLAGSEWRYFALLGRGFQDSEGRAVIRRVIRTQNKTPFCGQPIFAMQRVQAPKDILTVDQEIAKSS
jgi:hypothetical protein